MGSVISWRRGLTVFWRLLGAVWVVSKLMLFC
uniref:Uncharacterized protein MANES_14G068000 n=1 Tax=Rhizophora mucronata TaxID=61149 RepID=A0A2P2JZ86_RHIMU